MLPGTNLLNFDELNPYLSTVIGSTTVRFKRQNIYDTIQITPVADDCVFGDVSDKLYLNQHEGSRAFKRFFTNSIALRIRTHTNFMVTKIFQNGTIHTIGPPNPDICAILIAKVWSTYFKEGVHYELLDGYDKVVICYETVMINYNMDIGKNVLSATEFEIFINKFTRDRSMVHTKDSSNSPNIKLHYTMSDYDIKVIHMLLTNDPNPIWEKTAKSRSETFICDRPFKKKKETYCTFLMFRGGKMIMSGRDKVILKDKYIRLVSHIKDYLKWTDDNKDDKDDNKDNK